MFEIFIKSLVCHGAGGDRPQIKEKAVDAHMSSAQTEEKGLWSVYCQPVFQGELSQVNVQASFLSPAAAASSQGRRSPGHLNCRLQDHKSETGGKVV